MSLHTALSSGRYRHFRYLLRMGADVNSRGADGTTPLMLCCHLPNEHVASRAACCLLRRGADIGLKDRAGRNSLLHACVTGRRSHVELFLQPGCLDYDLNDTDKSGNTALHYAVVFGDPGIVQLVVTVLKKYNLRLHVRNNSGLTPYCLAIKKGLKECADIISPVLQVFPPTQESDSRISSHEPVRRLCRVQSAREGQRQDLKLLRGKDIVFMNSTSLWDMRKPREAFLAQTGPSRKTSASKKTRNNASERAAPRKGSEKSSSDRVRQLLLIQAMDQLPTFRKTAVVPPTDREVSARPLAPSKNEEAPSKEHNILKVVSLLASKASAPPRTESEPNLLKNWKRSALVSRRRTFSTQSLSPSSGPQRAASDRPGSDATSARRLVRDAFSSASNGNEKLTVSATVQTES